MREDKKNARTKHEVSDAGGIRMSDTVFEFSPAEKQVLEELPNAIGVYQFIQNKSVPVFLSERFIELFDYDSDEQAREAVRSDPYRDVHPDDVARISESRQQFDGGAPGYDVVYRNKTRRQTDYHIIHETGSHVWKEGTRLDYITCMDESRSLNNTEQGRDKHLSSYFLQEMSFENDLHRNQFDVLTGLPTIARFFQNARERIHEIRKQGKVPAILWFDFSRMHDYYAVHGFATGDSLILGLAGLIRDQFGFRSTARINNDCFAVCTENDHLEEKIRRIFDRAVKLNGENSQPIVTGIYIMDEEGVSLAAAVDRAKLACDSLHEPMHSSYVFFDQEMLANADLRRYLFQNYRKAMDRGWIQVYYQPVIRTVTGELCGAEALCRWIDPAHGMISPGMFIPALEDEGRTVELDLYMVEKVCRDVREMINIGGNIVPVSVNLSRKDFRSPDLVDRIEALAVEYKIPRELLNIEITESAFIRHAERLSKYISHFHELGYQVWMDDFGTAYSSLGSLKDLSFDELKIDMSFLSSYTEKARTIITSVVRMAKEIGIQTLAEGVETEEQYEFLKRIGCEKIQGYYFGKPMDKLSFLKHCRERQITEEPLRLKKYYDALGRVDFQTDEPLCLVEDDGVKLHMLFANDEYRDVLRRDNVRDIEAWFDEINTDNNPAHAFHRQYADEQLRKLPGPQVITYPSGDHYMELTGQVVTHSGTNYIYAMNIRCLQMNGFSEDERRASYIQYMYYLCSDIAVLDLADNNMYGLKSADSAQPIGAGRKTVDLAQAVRDYEGKFIYAEDIERYRAFIDLNTLQERMRQNKGQELMALFRSRKVDSDFRWMIHILMPIPNSDFKQFLLMTVPFYLDSDIQRLMQSGENREANEQSGDQEKGTSLTPSLLWKNMINYADGMYFWKDADRRFAGASRSFIDFYGFQSEDQFLGKTDEDMKWHIEPELFKKDELNVLQHGKSVSFAEGRCIVRGKPRTILANKIPIYNDGRIVGLMGNFYDAESLMHLLNDRYHLLSVDKVTDLLNDRGISEALKDCLEELWTSAVDFSMIKVHVREYTAFRKLYGEEAGDALLRSIADLLRGLFEKNGAIGRLTGSYFVVLVQDTDPDHREMFRTSIQKEIIMLRKAGEWPCALTADVHISVMNQTNASRENYAKSLDHMLERFGSECAET